MKLSICVPHYKEPWPIVKPLFDSIAIQRGVDFGDIELIIVQDGEDGALDAANFASYNLRITQYVVQHGGISKARNSGLAASKGDYVMWCDCDDCFHSAYGLHLIFSAIQEEPDIINSSFIEESVLKGAYTLFPHEADITFVHGKAFRKAFLEKERITFPEHITKHEDGATVGLAFQLTRNIKYIKTPFYTWVWNPESVMRKGGVAKQLLATYPELMEARIYFMGALKERRPDASIARHVAKSVFTAYYDFQRVEFSKEENRDLIRKAARAVQKFYGLFREEYLSLEGAELAKLANDSRNAAYEGGMLMEHMTIGQFLKMITGLKG